MPQFGIEQFPAVEFRPKADGNRMAQRRLEEPESLEILRATFPHGRLVRGPHPLEIATDDVIPADRRDQFPQHIRLPAVVPVEKADIASPGLRKSGFTGTRHSPVGRSDNDDPRIPLRTGAHETQRTVRRAVVHHDRLEIAERLRLDRSQAGVDIPFEIVDRNNHRDLRPPFVLLHPI